MLYMACGDGGSGEQTGAIRQHQQRLDTLVGKILRIVPDLSLHTQTTTISENRRYRIPRDNPFASVEGARKEIWAYRFRNPHSLTWDVDPVSGVDHLIAANIGLHTWETIYIVHKGANYGYPAREGTQLLQADNRTAPLPSADEIPVQVSDTRRTGKVVPRYPVAQYAHTRDGGDAISGGFVYRGTLLPSLVGKYVFGDITTGRIWFADLKEMLAADDTNAATLATAHPLQVQWDDPSDSPNHGPPTFAKGLRCASCFRRCFRWCWRRTRRAAVRIETCRVSRRSQDLVGPTSDSLSTRRATLHSEQGRWDDPRRHRRDAGGASVSRVRPTAGWADKTKHFGGPGPSALDCLT